MKPYFFLFVILLSFNSMSFGQGKLIKAEESISKKEKSKPKHSNNENKSSNSHSSNDNIARIFIEAFLYVSYYTLIESPFEREHLGSNSTITKHPYLNSKKGNYSYNQGEDTDIFRAVLSSRFIFETNRLYGNHLNMDMRFFQRAGLDIDYLQLWEENPNFGNNALAIYTALTKYHRVRTERFNAWWGLGASYIDGSTDQLGFTYGIGAELFFAQPLSLESNFNQTLINNSTVNKFNALLNFHKNRYKFTGGYQHLKIGGIDFSTFSIGAGVAF